MKKDTCRGSGTGTSVDVSTEMEKRGVIHRQSLSIPFAIWGDDGGGVAVVTDPANVVLTGQEVLLLTDKTFTQERNARGHLGYKGQLRSQCTTMSKRSCYF